MMVRASTWPVMLRINNHEIITNLSYPGVNDGRFTTGLASYDSVVNNMKICFPYVVESTNNLFRVLSCGKKARYGIDTHYTLNIQIHSHLRLQYMQCPVTDRAEI